MNLMLLDAILWLRRQLGVVYAVMYCFDVVPPILFTKAVQRNRRKKNTFELFEIRRDIHIIFQNHC